MGGGGSSSRGTGVSPSAAVELSSRRPAFTDPTVRPRSVRIYPPRQSDGRAQRTIEIYQQTSKVNDFSSREPFSQGFVMSEDDSMTKATIV